VQALPLLLHLHLQEELPCQESLPLKLSVECPRLMTCGASCRETLQLWDKVRFVLNRVLLLREEGEGKLAASVGSTLPQAAAAAAAADNPLLFLLRVSACCDRTKQPQSYEVDHSTP
jgi:hypothetical protein